MSHSSFSASERRGILAVAIIALLLIGGGLGVTMCESGKYETQEIPAVVEHPEMVDSVAVKEKEEKEAKKKSKKEKSASEKGGSKDKSKSTKIYRRRSPRDEPV